MKISRLIVSCHQNVRFFSLVTRVLLVLTIPSPSPLIHSQPSLQGDRKSWQLIQAGRAAHYRREGLRTTPGLFVRVQGGAE